MEILGSIEGKVIYYLNLRRQTDWHTNLPGVPWIAYTIVGNEDKDLLNDLVNKCLDTPLGYSCSAGELSSLTEEYFDEEEVLRVVDEEIKTGKEIGYEASPMTSFHNNFSDGLWFACVTANQIIDGDYIKAQTVVCLDCTIKGVRNHLLNLIKQINDGWLPSDEEFEAPHYDS